MRRLRQVIISLIMILIALISDYDFLFIVAYIISGYDVILKAIRNIFMGKVFDENFLMTVATVGAFCIGEFAEACAVMIFYQIGEFFQSYAVDKSRRSIAELMDIRADYANVYREGEIEKVDPSEVNIGEVILIKPYEKIPLDGKVIEGESSLNTRALTGEVIPRCVTVDDEVLSGCVNNDGFLKVKVESEFENSTVSKILDLVENVSSRKSKSENFISKFARYYTPCVVFIAILLALVPPFFIDGQLFSVWVYRALSFLVVSCPCALVISVPLSFFGGIGAASRIGVLIKGSNYLEDLAKTEIIAIDKTGTLTEGVFKVRDVQAVSCSSSDLLKYAAYAEIFSNHPIAQTLKTAYGKSLNEKLVTEAKEIAGKGVKVCFDGKQILAGNDKLMNDYGIGFDKIDTDDTVVYVAVFSVYAGYILVSDKIKDDSYEAIEDFKRRGIKTVMLTGDRENVSQSVALKLGLDEYHAQLLPADKVSFTEKLIGEKSSSGKLLFVGDGINDAPAMALADIGVAMGGLGSDAAVEAADVVIMSDEVSKIAQCIWISKKTMSIVKQNIWFAIMVKIGVLVFSAFGIVSMWVAVFADVGVSFLAIINALRILKIRGISCEK